MVITISSVGQAILDAYNSHRKANFAPNVSQGRPAVFSASFTNPVQPRTTPAAAAAIAPTRLFFDNLFSPTPGTSTFKSNPVFATNENGRITIVGAGSQITPRVTGASSSPPVNLSLAPAIPLPLQVTGFSTPSPSSAGLFDSLKAGLSDIQRSVGPTGIAIAALILGVVLIKKI